MVLQERGRKKGVHQMKPTQNPVQHWALDEQDCPRVLQVADAHCLPLGLMNWLCRTERGRLAADGAVTAVTRGKAAAATFPSALICSRRVRPTNPGGISSMVIVFATVRR
jgi:hypothetical protein